MSKTRRTHPESRRRDLLSSVSTLPPVPYGYLSAIALVALATAFCEQLRPYLSPINMVMAYLLAVVLAAVRLGRRPAVLTAFLGVFAFDFFFVPPRFSFRISDTEYLFTFLALFIVGIVISTLVARSFEQLEALGVRERHTATLYHLSRDLAAALDTATLLTAVIANLEKSLNAQVALYLQREGGFELAASSNDLPAGPADRETALWSYRSRRPAGRGSAYFSRSPLSFLPIKALADTVGVLAVRLPEGEDLSSPLTRRLLDACATQTALALERVRLSAEAQQLQILKGRENLERALLNSVSHDLRTPLATITGVLSAVLDETGRLAPEAQRELLETAREEAGRLNSFVGKLLDMSRLESGALRPRLEPCDVQDLIGCALAAVEKRAGARGIEVRLEPDLPLIPLDPVLMIQVLVNLLDNALKYGSPQRGAEISCRLDESSLRIEVADRGPGVPEHDLPRIFDKFYRTPEPEGVGGTGLGLSICRGIVEAHGGSVRAENREGGGLRVVVTVPQSAPSQGGQPR